MLRKFLKSPALVGAVLCFTAAAQDTSPSGFLQKHCVSCHNDKARVASLSLEHPDSSPAVWGKVLDKLITGRMPPPGSPPPSKAEVTAVTAWIESSFGHAHNAGPGHVTARRLNRVEYNSTVRDLLAVSLRPADEFPLDDAGYGFDNIGDVLSVSPLLMEKYLQAAKKLSHAAIYGEPAPPKPTKLIRYLSKKSQDDPTPNALPYSYRGAIWGGFDFPADAVYEFHMRDANYRSRYEKLTPRQLELRDKRSLTEAEKRELSEENRKQYPPVRMVMTVDGVQVLTEVVEGSIDFQYAHGEAIARVPLKAGWHAFRASYPEFADMPDLRDNVNLDGRRKLFIDYVDIVGPFDRSAGPPESAKRIFVCPEKTAACASKIVEHLARRAYRRPVTKQEVDALTHLAALVQQSGDSFEEGIRVALQAILMSPNFLFRVEREPADGGYAIDEHALASRLSYFLWSSMPDEDLLRAAAEGRLRRPDVLEAQVLRMLRDPKSDAFVESFAGQWLGLRLLERRKPDPARFPLVDDELIDAMRQETTLFARAILRDDGSVLDFLDGRFSFLNGPLARHYGIPGVKGEQFRRVEFDGAQRGGVLTQGSVLTLSSYATRTSPVLRGKWVLDNLLGTPPSPPPPGTPLLQESNLGTDASLRQRLEQHRADAACAVCHNQMDPIGFGLEHYDASGAWRDQDGKFPIDSSGSLPGGASFSGAKELQQVLKSQAGLFIRNLTERMLTYALGRGLETGDQGAVDRIAGRLASNGYRSSTLIMEIVKSDAFQMRKQGGGELASK